MKTDINSEKAILFERDYSSFGKVEVMEYNHEDHLDSLHDWVNRDYAFFWGLQNSSVENVREEYDRLLEPDHYYIFIGMYQEKMSFLMEQYNPKLDEVGLHYPVQNGDAGIHIILAPSNKKKIENFSWHMFQTILDFVFCDPEINRIVVEPDIRNKKMFAICQRVGFELDEIIELPHKTAQLAFLTREKHNQMKNTSIHKRSVLNAHDNTVSPQQSTAHISSEVWAKANRLLVRKELTEFSHERILNPQPIHQFDEAWSLYQVFADDEAIVYEFKARLLMMNQLLIDTDTIVKRVNGENQDLDAVLFIKEFRNQLGIDNNRLPVYLEEILSTLHGSVFKHTKGNPVAAELAQADFQTIEQAMMEGHPGFVANNGRIGFDSSDYISYAPEAGNSFSLLWLAGHKDNTVYSGLESLPYQKTIIQELGEEIIGKFNEAIENKGYNPDDYLFIPVHPWQWFNKLSNIFASEIAVGRLICLGYSPDQYMAQQSIRTLFNISNPEKFYTKTSLSILNMGFMRGLPLYYLGTAPKMAVWLEDLLYNDPYIQRNGYRMLSEVASVSYVNQYFEEFGPHNDYNKMIASLWRESPMANVEEGQTPMTMAALLHIDHEGNALLPELIKASDLSTDDWLRSYFKAYLSPMVHCFYKHDLVFMPHGENIILVMENHAPKYMFLKDITEEACILSPDVELPEHLKRMYAPVPDDVKLLSIFTDMFDGFFRYMALIMVEHMGYDEKRFWELVAENVSEYQEEFPELNQKFEKYDLFAEDFKLSCLNRLQLNDNKQMIDLDDPVALLQFAGRLENPLHIFKAQESI
ncbi:GNAT family N-acetyltransferase [Aureibacter tunicatorum]|uniref:Siderophore synthetase component/RimJ/RimL family protein N-acetyltransferase n=1 Tax=Aureibacter tunicatorum TaxID=866807 RepID=A0AAE3XQ11_9BACT|nr:GNAT family N-acetyltransferase [Aureibacter tunicatorum]MDR6241022.1 siderophore synthetase component/RimJ/RimL family protein N-acetyltransferase [Aureibacter tunicatorum]BDD03800.1 hypothetical protein AUTU_12830 [Aureibacter tunicatorum]